MQTWCWRSMSLKGMRHADKRGHLLSLVKHAILGCQHVFPQLRGSLSTTWANLKVWEEERSSQLRPPLPVPILLCAVGLSRAHAVTSRDSRLGMDWTLFSVLLEIGFFCLLRPGELLRLRHKDIAMPSSFVLCEQHVAFKIVSPKNRRQFGDNQFVLLKNRNCIAWLKKIHLPSEDKPLWIHSPRVFANMMKQIMRELGVDACNFTPASLRPGGATMYYSAGISVSTLRFMGRWSVERSLEHYIQLAMAAQIMNQLSSQAISRLKKIGPLCLNQVWCQDIPWILRSHCDSVLAWCREYVRLDRQCRA